MRFMFVLALPLLLATPASAGLAISFEKQEVVVQGVSPGGSVAFLGIEKQPGHFRAEVTYRRELLSDSDADGVISYPLKRDVPSTSVWAFVDIATGAAIVATPEDDVMEEVEFPADGSLRDEGDEFVLVDDRRKELELLYVRPRLTAWRTGTSDGSASDKDGAPDGRVKIHLDDLQELGGGGRQVAEVLPGDIVIGLDRYKGEYFVIQLDSTAGR